MKGKSLRTFLLIVVTFLGLIFFISQRWIKADTQNPTITASEPTSTPKKKVNQKPLAKSKQLDVPLINQMDEPTLYNGCEVTSLAMILQYYGMVVSKNDLANAITSVPLQDESGYMGNPNQAFVGDITGGGDGGLGVYHKPIARLAKQYVDPKKVKDITGSDFDSVLEQVAAGNPVWIITTAVFAPVDSFQSWSTADGDIQITFDMHSVVVTGYDEDYIYINNPYGEKDQQLEKDDFIAAFEQMGSQAIYLNV